MSVCFKNKQCKGLKELNNAKNTFLLKISLVSTKLLIEASKSNQNINSTLKIYERLSKYHTSTLQESFSSLIITSCRQNLFLQLAFALFISEWIPKSKNTLPDIVFEKAKSINIHTNPSKLKCNAPTLWSNFH